jgi:hypothetical protein
VMVHESRSLERVENGHSFKNEANSISKKLKKNLF